MRPDAEPLGACCFLRLPQMRLTSRPSASLAHEPLAAQPLPTRLAAGQSTSGRLAASQASSGDGRFVREFRRSLAEACERGEFRVSHYSLQGDHAHLIVEARGKDALGRGMKSVGARLARALNRTAGRSGPVLDGRYHHRSLRTPREVRRALAYVLLNARRHLAKARGAARAGPARLDPASSARWFDGWRRGAALAPRPENAVPEVARPHTWLLRVGWRRHGLVDPAELPAAALATG